MKFTSLLFILLIKAALLAGIAWWSGIGLSPDEAQYWTWSQRLALGYYSKPPGIAWQIAAGTYFLGDTVGGVRLFAQVIGLLFPLLIYALAKRADLTDKQAFWAALATALSPLGWLASLLAITDGGLILFWCLAMLPLMRGSPNYFVVGLCIACGALFKWPIYWFWLLLGVAIPFAPRLWNRTLIPGVLLSFIGLLPSLIWNISHDWVTFRHVEATLVNENLPDTGTTMLMKGNFWDFLGSQAALLSPILFILLIGAVVEATRKWKSTSEAIKICYIFGVVPLAIFLVASLFKKMQGNWCQFAYPGLLILLVWYASERWLQRGLVLSCALVAAVFAVPGLLRSGAPISPKINPFKHNVGWEYISDNLSELGYDPQKEFLFTDKYQTTAITWFYGPEQHPSYFFNLQGVRLNQFSFWPGMEQLEVGNTGYFIIVENEPHLSRQRESLIAKTPTQLAPYFAQVDYLGEKPLFLEAKKMMVWKCVNYNGKTPADSHKY
jgi:4-amino-4-deoxy-L-arabinose transferase-like glycosyltransferase